nr:protein argonaute 2-like [Penaeus vannamei]
MQERANDLMKSENSQDSFGSGGYQGMEGSNWRRTSDSYGTQGGSSWRGGGSDSWGRSAGADRGSYQRGNSESELPPPPDPNTFLENFNRGRNFEQGANDYAGQRGRDAGRSRWGRNDRDDYGPAKRARY